MNFQNDIHTMAEEQEASSHRYVAPWGILPLSTGKFALLDGFRNLISIGTWEDLLPLVQYSEETEELMDNLTMKPREEYAKEKGLKLDGLFSLPDRVPNFKRRF